jgi:16S rRNA (guanine527-N7)-methyltransferase
MENKVEAMLGYLKIVATKMDIGVTAEQYVLFGRYYDFLLEYNQKINLTRIIEPMDVAAKHFGDSLAVLASDVFSAGKTVADIGTGAGFPGMVIAIMCPDIQVTLVDSLRKRTVFLFEMVQRLGLNNVTVLWTRAEDMGQNPLYREKYDVVLARAVASLNVLAELCLPLLKTGGSFLAMKGPKAEEELSLAHRAIKTLGGVVVSSVSTPLTLVGEERTLIIIGKKRATAAIYPRKAGIPEREPLA